MNAQKVSKGLLWSGAVLIALSLFLFLLIFYPVLKEEFKYRFGGAHVSDNATVVITTDPLANAQNVIVPASNDFSIIVPKIGGNAPVVPNIDSQNESVYRRALKDGVAHAKDSALPDIVGNTFLFAHSSDNFYEANRYNTVFYLLHKMEEGDDFMIVYEDEIYNYNVTGTEEVRPEAVEYLKKGENNKQTATLMTCWPPGTAANRLLIHGELIEIQDLP